MHNFHGIQAKADSFRKGYLLDAYDQPTYLSFAIDFRFEQTNSAISDGLWSSPLFEKGDANNTNSAQTYLGSIHHKDKEENLVKFKSILEYLTFNAPWYFQSISGLETLWKNATNMSGGNKSTSSVLTIDTLEAIDLRITEIANLYRTAIYDKQSMRERVPDNLRWFAMDIYIAEARNIRYEPLTQFSNMSSAMGINTGAINRAATQITSGVGSIIPDADLGNPMKQFGYVKFKCRQCEFDFTNSFAGGQKMSVIPGQSANTNAFSIKVGYFEEESEYHDSSKLTDDGTTASRKNPWSAMNTAANLQNGVEGASFLPVVGDSVSSAIQQGQKKLQLIGGMVNPALGASFNNPPARNLGNIYK